MSTAAPAVRNYWPDTKCAKAFWSQHHLPTYQRLLADTAAWLDPRPGERWLDLGCGCGQLTRAVWEKSRGMVGEVVAMDCAAINARAIDLLANQVEPQPRAGQIRFVQANFSEGLPAWDDRSFDGAVSGLAIQYAESYDEERQAWTTEAYDRLLAEMCRVLRPGGRFVFSVNVPEPSWYTVALTSLHGLWQAPSPRRYVKDSLRMLQYGAWLTREARTGRFHYLPSETISARLLDAGFAQVRHRLSYARQAYLFHCQKPA